MMPILSKSSLLYWKLMKTLRRLACSPKEFLPLPDRARPDLVFQKRQVIYTQSDVARDLFYLVMGEVKLSVTSAHGREAVTAVLRAGDFFGEGCIGDQGTRKSTATAISLCYIVRVGKVAMLSILSTQKSFNRCFVSYLISKNGRTQEDLLAQIFDSTEKRLARTLLQLARYGTKSKPEPIIPQMSQETLARMIGATRSHVNIFMAKFRKSGHITHNGNRKWKVNRSLLKVVQAA
jgi:CRP/FNR family cyclic AMP-dependent transcriptional regulator